MTENKLTTSVILLLLCAGVVAGTGWILIKSQITVVTAEASVFNRFLQAAPISILVGRLWFKDFIPMTLRMHIQLFLIGLFMYGAFYWFSYRSIEYVPSGIISVIMSMMLLTNAVFCRIFLKEKIKKNTVYSMFFCTLSLLLLFYDDVLDVDGLEGAIKGFSLSIFAICCYSIGTVFLRGFDFKGLSSASISGYAMMYGGIISLISALMRADSVFFDFSIGYILPLVYLGTILTPFVMISYIFISKNYSATLAAAMWIIMPIVGIMLSSFFNEFEWNYRIICALLLAMPGLYLLIYKK